MKSVLTRLKCIIPIIFKNCSQFREDKVLSHLYSLASILCACRGMPENNLFNCILHLFDAEVFSFCVE